jgi:hypothetical protein
LGALDAHPIKTIKALMIEIIQGKMDPKVPANPGSILGT